jgi:hypothetical protein
MRYRGVLNGILKSASKWHLQLLPINANLLKGEIARTIDDYIRDQGDLHGKRPMLLLASCNAGSKASIYAVAVPAILRDATASATLYLARWPRCRLRLAGAIHIRPRRKRHDRDGAH